MKKRLRLYTWLGPGYSHSSLTCHRASWQFTWRSIKTTLYFMV